jgi:coenzyme F420 biosynthesis associated uncharacterized protein
MGHGAASDMCHSVAPYALRMDAIDWSLAQRVGELLSGTPPPGRPSAESVQPLVERFAAQVASYSGLELPEALPQIELVDRASWIEANIATMRPLLEPLGARLGEGSGPMAGAMRAASGLLLGAQVGAVTGVLSQRVLGQYDIALLDEERPPRLLLVAPNLVGAARNMALAREELVTWVAIHEVTHAVQFGGAQWLRTHLAGMLRELIEGLDAKVSMGRSLRLPDTEDLRGFAQRVRDGQFLRLTLGEQRWGLVERMQTTMSLIEGHAEHVMDAVGEQALPSLAQMRSAMTRRRRERAWPWRILERMLGMELKMRQYEVGRRFCDAVVAEAGPQGLSVVWRSAEMLPSASEIEDPGAWLARTRVPPVTIYQAD